jgi:hypothetical protein
MTDLGDQRFIGLLETAPDAMVCVERDGRIALVNRPNDRHLRGPNYAEDFLTPAAEGLHPARRGTRRPVYVNSEPWPGIPIRRSSRAADRADGTWPNLTGHFNPHDHRHTHRTWLEDAGLRRSSRWTAAATPFRREDARPLRQPAGPQHHPASRVPGQTELALRKLRIADPALLPRAAVIDQAADDLVAEGTTKVRSCRTLAWRTFWASRRCRRLSSCCFSGWSWSTCCSSSWRRPPSTAPARTQAPPSRHPHAAARAKHPAPGGPLHPPLRPKAPHYSSRWNALMGDDHPRVDAPPGHVPVGGWVRCQASSAAPGVS